MISRSRTRFGGFTIIEVLIYLGVSTALFVAVAALVAGQQQKTEFSQSIRDSEQQIQDIINDLATGYYPNIAQFSCSTPSAGAPKIVPGTTGQGANSGCIFIGRVLHFMPSGSSNDMYNIFTVVGRRLTGSASNSRNVSSLAEAFPTAIAPDSSVSNVPNGIETRQLRYGLTAKSIRQGQGGPASKVSLIGFFSTLSPGANESGTTEVELVTIGNGSARDAREAARDINTNTFTVNPPGGVVLCFDSGSTDQRGEITIGGSSQGLVTQLTISKGNCP